MTLEKTNELLAKQALMGGGYTLNSAKPILAEVMREHGPSAVDSLIGALEPERIFGFKPGTEFKR